MLKFSPRASRAALPVGVFTTAVPAGYTGAESAAEQARMCLSDLDARLEAAGTSRARILEATVFLADLSAFPEMDAAWAAWVPEGAEPSRATVGANLLPGMKIEIKVTAAEP